MKVDNKIKFTTSDLYWLDYKKKEHLESLGVLNKLTEKQKKAVQLFMESIYSKGSADGYESGYRENYE